VGVERSHCLRMLVKQADRQSPNPGGWKSLALWPLAAGLWLTPWPLDGAPPAGSPIYAAPENFIEGDIVTFSADVWSLAITLFELVTGALPYKAIPDATSASAIIAVIFFFFFITLGLELSDTKVYEP